MCEFNFAVPRAHKYASLLLRADLCAITHLLERGRIPLTENGQRFRNCSVEGSEKEREGETERDGEAT